LIKIFPLEWLPKLTDWYPNSAHVDTLGLGTSSDRDVWEYARLNDFMIVTKDADFSELSILLGTPPKVIWIRRGNCSTNAIEKLLRENYSDINAFSSDLNVGVLTLF
jgi:predicted nuclease of predicted toxin-antitoxin system